ncbi:TerB family tellurite resistance protein [Mucilaginibacter sp.]|uniref:TerB family tellurite resistance protein n=1 Tax=Mucilaginibacter sp. TaxID=1882438 RepID=UPI00262E6606|nr:TerB family tellurite resistance protein [Mucilaginibacter sp.]
MMVALCFMICTFSLQRTYAQASTAQDVQQLLYDIEKLTQFKAILSDMETGYTILTQGYEAVKSISEGNFNLHSAFLNSLEAISPSVRQYGRIADVIANQASIVSEYKNAWKQANASGRFTASELIYMNRVFTQLLNQSVDNLTNLTNIITANTLRMSDAERLQAIDHIYSDTQNKLTFLRGFNNQLAILSLERAKEQNDLQMLKKLY